MLDPGLRGLVRVLGGPGTGKSSLLIDVAATRIGAGTDPGRRDVDQQRALTRSRAAEHPHQAAQSGIEHSAGLGAPVVRHIGMTPRGSDTSARPVMGERPTGTIDA